MDATPEQHAPAAPGVQSIRSPYPLSETLERLDATILERGLIVFAMIDHRAEAERVGLVMHSARLLVFGNPKAGTPLMVASPLLALDLPLKALVWQDRAETVWVSYTSPEYLIDRYALPQDLAAHVDVVGVLVEAALRA